MSILGSRGLSRIAGLLLSSVSEWILNEAPCSILISRPTARKTKSSASFNVLLAIDGSYDAWKAVDLLKSFQLSVNATVTLLHVIKKQLYKTRQIVESKGKNRAEFTKLAKELCRDRDSTGVSLLKDTRDALPSSTSTIQECLVLGHEAEEILKMARQQKADLVIVEAKGVKGLRRMMM